MNRFCFIIGIIIGFCSVGQSVWANTAYIIDFTKVNFRSGPSTEYRVWLFPEKVDTVKRKISVCGFHTQRE